MSFGRGVGLIPALLVILLSGCTASPPPELSPDVVQLPPGFDLQGHRGARGLSPENTLPSFETALDLGVTTLELDLHLSKDDQVIIWHDAVVSADKCRLKAEAPNHIPNPDTSPLIRSLTAADLSWFACDLNPDMARFPNQIITENPLAAANYSIVPLSALFDLVAQYSESELKTEEQRANALTVQFNLEMKRDPNNPEAIGDGFDGTSIGVLESRTLAALRFRGLANRSVIQSFDHRSLQTIHEADPTIALAVLTFSSDLEIPIFAEDLPIIWSPNYEGLTKESIDEAHNRGYKVIPWTVNNQSIATSLIDAGVDGLITDVPNAFSLPPP